MKNRKKLTRSGLCGLLFLILAFALPGCFIFDDADEGTVTINLGGNTRTAGWGSKAIENYLDYTITLKGKKQIERDVSGGGTISMTVPTGSYDITIDVTCYEEPYATSLPASIDVKTGNNPPVEIKMTKTDTTFYTVASKTDWETDCAAIRGGGSNKKYVIILTNDIKVSDNTDIVWNSNSNSPPITLTIFGNNKTMTLTEPGNVLNVHTGQTFIVQDLKMVGYDGNNTTAVYVNGGEFTMRGSSSVSGNTHETVAGVADGRGGGVRVDSGTFIMNGGTISGNTSGSDGGGGFVNN
ncbi:MAG: hypothetical protein FWG13_08200, partial [Leptospirales bacterium]|nr:hypothetical protein [Leptospirales bacterium]